MKKSEKNRRQAYIGCSHSCKVSERNDIFCGLCKKYKISVFKNVDLDLF